MLKGISKAGIIFISVLSSASFSGYSQTVSDSPAEIQVIPSVKRQNCPEIPNLEYKDFLYKQYSEDLQQYYKDLAQNKKTKMVFYSYTAKKDDTIFTISSRCNIPYDTIATLNEITAADVRLEGKLLILPAAPGVFVPDNGTVHLEKPLTSLEALIQKNYNDKLHESDYFCYIIDGRYFLHLPEDRLDQTTRAFFLDVKMKPPLDKYWLSSDYGYRPSPFSGQKQFHRGIDMAAPEGTKVYSCKTGTVAQVVKNDSVFGNYIVIKHVNGLSSIYAHLSKIEVKTGQTVTTGQEIGLVGMTGQVTGPHLHFVIRQNGQPTDPGAYIKR